MEHPRSMEQRVMSLLVDFRATVLRHSPQIERPRLQSLLGEAHIFAQTSEELCVFFYRAVDQSYSFNRKARGMIGYVLTELLNITEAAHETEIFDQVALLTRKWCTTALASKTPIEMAALCCVLVKLRAFDELEKMPQENESQVVSWMTREILACVNELVHEELYVEAYHVLHELRRLSEERPKAAPKNLRASVGYLSNDVSTEIKSKME